MQSFLTVLENFKENYYEKLLGEIDIGIDNIYKIGLIFCLKRRRMNH